MTAPGDCLFETHAGFVWWRVAAVDGRFIELELVPQRWTITHGTLARLLKNGELKVMKTDNGQDPEADAGRTD